MFLQLVAPQKTAPVTPEDYVTDDGDLDLTDEDLTDGMAQFEAWFPNDMKPR